MSEYPARHGPLKANGGSHLGASHNPKNNTAPTARPPAMNTSLKFLARLAFISGMLAVSASAMAHRSGCHQGHSCPSDTGSYVCGDTGHSNECGRSEAASPPRNGKERPSLCAEEKRDAGSSPTSAFSVKISPLLTHQYRHKGAYRDTAEGAGSCCCMLLTS